MIRASVFLSYCSLKNRLLRAVARLRQPRYAAGAAVAAAYFWFFFFRDRGARIAEVQQARIPEMMLVVISAFTLVILIGVWALPGDSPGLLFSEAEIQFLFPAPVSRGQLLAYKVLRGQLRGLLSALVFSLFVFRGGHIIGIWLAFAAFDVYSLLASFVRARLKLAGIGWGWRLAAAASGLFAAGAVAVHQFRGNARLILTALSLQQPINGELFRAIDAVAWKPPLGILLYPGKWVGLAVYPSDRLALVESWAVLAVAGLFFFFLATRLDVAFEDASIVASQRALARRARMRASRSGTGGAAVHRFPAPFRLAKQGRPEVAVIWKNLIGALRTSSFPMLALILPVAFAAAASIFHRQAELAVIFGGSGLVAAGAMALLGPQVVRSDLRIDILRLDLVKSFPLSAETLLAAELAAPLLIISLGELLLLGVSVGILSTARNAIPFFTSPEFVVSALIFIVPLCAIELLIQNAGMILFPAWATAGGETRGFAVMGQRLLMLLANFLTLMVTLAPAAVVLAPSFWLAHRFLGSTPLAVLLASIPAAAVLVGEIAIAHKILAGQFEEIDLANDLEALSGV